MVDHLVPGKDGRFGVNGRKVTALTGFNSDGDGVIFQKNDRVFKKNGGKGVNMAGKNIRIKRSVEKFGTVGKSGKLIQSIKDRNNFFGGGSDIYDFVFLRIQLFLGPNGYTNVLIEPKIGASDGTDLGVFLEEIEISFETVFGQNIILAHEEQ